MYARLKVTFVLTIFVFLLLPVELQASEADKNLYQSQPFRTTRTMIPEILIVLSKDMKMFQQGYPGLVDMDGDGRVDTGFNPGVVYVGYFDSESCYGYSGSEYTGLQGFFAVGDVNGYFYRAGASLQDDSQEQIMAARPWTSNGALKQYVVSPRSKSGVCRNRWQRVTDRNGYGTFSGNWLNYITTSRMDAIRKVLYGGSRSVDTLDRTVLELSFVPPDSTVWGSEVQSDYSWTLTPLNAYYDVSKYTPYDKPLSGKAHFFARGRDLGNRYFPALRVLLNVDRNSFTIGGVDSVGENIVVTPPQGRYWDWSLVNRPLPDDRVLSSSARRSIKSYRLHVEVCANGNIGPKEGCLRYPGDAMHPWGVYKPSGLLQKYSETSPSPMYFGLMTGSYGNPYQGGVLRNHIAPLYGKPGDPLGNKPAINRETGQILPGGLISSIDKLRISGRTSEKPESEPGDKSKGTGPGSFFVNYGSWGNPLGELMFEGLRYISRASSPTPEYSNKNDSDVATSPINSLSMYSGNYSWMTARPQNVDISCGKPAILLISDINSDHDNDGFNGYLNIPAISGLKLAPGLSLPDTFNVHSYLDAISNIEGYNGYNKYFYSSGRTDNCNPKPLSNGLKMVNGLCPDGPAQLGGYSVAAVAYYARTRNINRMTEGELQVPPDIYTVTMSNTFPELSFPVRFNAGSVSQSINILPSGATAREEGILNLLNYFVIKWESDRNGHLFEAEIKVNFSDIHRGDDWEGDAQVTYTINLLTNASTPAFMRTASPLTINSGALKGQVLYGFKNPDTVDKRSDFIQIEPGQIKGILINSRWSTTGTKFGMAMGYTISGTTYDGTYMDLSMNMPPKTSLFTPPNCPYVLGPSNQGCGRAITNLKAQSRSFAIAGRDTLASMLPNPLWLAGKYSSFIDYNRNGRPDQGEWENAEGQPRNYFQAASIAELSDKIEKALITMSKSKSSNTSTAPSVSTESSGGLSVQTLYYPEYEVNDQDLEAIWLGSVYGLFIDSFGNLREDSNHDGILTLANGPWGQEGDYIISFNDPNDPPENLPACYNPNSFISRCYDPYGTNDPVLINENVRGSDNIHQISALWDSGRWLAELSDERKLQSGSRPYNQPATKATSQRRIYYGHPEKTGTTMRLFNYLAAETLAPLLIHDNFRDHLPGTYNQLEGSYSLIDYIYGVDWPFWRSRKVISPWGQSQKVITWRLGDILNSKPVIVGSPVAGFDTLYGDTSYTEYRLKNANRRKMAYFGSNDGMLHAINLGFQDLTENGEIIYKTTREENGRPLLKHDLGAELWAYIPTSLLPHLKWLADPDYIHSYYVDLKPLLADFKIGGQWRTVLIGGLRLGGRPIASPDTSEEKYIYSEVFALDVTDPENEPELLWRYSSHELGLMVGLPTVVSSGGKFYVVLASGPVADTLLTNEKGQQDLSFGQNSPYAAYSNQKARLIVLSAETGREVVDRNQESNQDYLEVLEDNSFLSDPFLPRSLDKESPFNHHAVYYGLTVSRDIMGFDKGAVYRLKMVDEFKKPLPVEKWELKRLIHTEKPVTGAVNSTMDGNGNLWVIFGTGRLWSQADISPCFKNYIACQVNHEQYLFGIKEEMEDGVMTFADLTERSKEIVDVSGAVVFKDGRVIGLKSQDLVATGIGGSTNYVALSEAISSDSIGYKRKLEIAKTFNPTAETLYEMILTQPKISAFGHGQSLTAFTSYDPALGTCGESGEGYMYMVDTFTGLPAPEMYSAFYNSSQNLPFGHVTGAVQIGSGKPSEAIIINVDGKTIVRASGDNGSIHDINMEQNRALNKEMISWREVFDMGLEFTKEDMILGLE